MSKIKVLICDDHSLFREGVKASLQYRSNISIVGEAVDGVDLLNKLSYLDVDVILLDINMPKMDGIAVLPVIKSNDKYKHIKVIILSMHNQMSMVSRMMSLGANSYVTKNNDIEVIYDAIVTCYEKDYYFNDLTNRSLLTMIKKNPTLILQDEEFIETDTNRKQKNLVPKENIQEKPSKTKNYTRLLTNGLVMGLIAGVIICIFWVVYKNLNQNLNFITFDVK